MSFHRVYYETPVYGDELFYDKVISGVLAISHANTLSPPVSVRFVVRVAQKFFLAPDRTFVKYYSGVLFFDLCSGWRCAFFGCWIRCEMDEDDGVAFDGRVDAMVCVKM